MRPQTNCPRWGRFLALAGLGSGLLFAAASASAAPLMSAKVTQIIKEVTLLPGGGASRRATISDEVSENSAVRTGNDSRAELTFTDLTLTRLGANTVFSFNRGKREIDLSSGAVLVQVPRNGETATVRTAAATAAISGGTAMTEYHVGYPLKVYVLEGVTEVCTLSGECVTLPAGQMLTSSNGKLNKPTGFNIQKLYSTSLLLTDFAPLPNDDLIQQQIQDQQQNNNSDSPPTNSTNNNNDTDVVDVVDLRTSASPPPTQGETPSGKFGSPTTISSPDPYVIGSGTQINTDPTIVTNGVTDQGKIFRDRTQDGEPTQFVFGEAPNALDNLVFDTSGPNDHPTAVFKFAHLQLTGDPIVSIPNGSPTRLALASVGDITTGGPGGTITFAGIDHLSLITQNGSITLGSEISFTDFQNVEAYARGSGSNLTIASPVSGIDTIKLAAGGTVQVNGDESVNQFEAFTGTNFAVGTGVITASVINIRSLGDINVDTAQFNQLEDFADTMDLHADGTVNFAVQSGVFPWDLTIHGTTINMTGDAELDFPNSSVTANAGTGGFNAPSISFVGPNLTIDSAGDITVASVDLPTAGIEGPPDLSVAGSLTAQGTITSTIGDLQSLSISAGGVSAAGTIYVGDIFSGNDITAGGDIHAVGGSIHALGNITATNGSIQLDVGAPGGFGNADGFGNVTAGGNITAGNGIFTPGTPCVVSAGGFINVTGAVITGTLQAGGAITVQSGDVGFTVALIANSITAGGTLSLTNVDEMTPDNSVASGGLSFTPVDFSLQATAIVSTGSFTPYLHANGAAASEANADFPGNGGNISINITQAGLTVGEGQNFQSIHAWGGDFDTDSFSAGGNGGNIGIIAAGNVSILPSNNTSILASTGLVPDVLSTYAGAGGTVTVTTPGTIDVSGTIQVSSDDARNFTQVAPPAVGGDFSGRESASGGTIDLQSNATTGVGINVSGSLLSLLSGEAPGPGGSITLSTMGANIVVTGTLEADYGAITIDQNDPPGLTPTITIDGARLVSDSLTINGAGDVSIGLESPVTIEASNISISAPRSIGLDANEISAGGLLQLVVTNPGTAITGDASMTVHSAGDLSAGTAFLSFNNNGGDISGNASLTITAVGNITTSNSFFANLDNFNGASIGGNALVSITATDVSADSFAANMSNAGGQITGTASTNINVANLSTAGFAQFVVDNTNAGSVTGITLGLQSSASVATADFFETFVNNSGGQVQNSVSVMVNATGDLTNLPIGSAAQSGLFFDIYNVGGTIGTDALLQVNVANLSDTVYAQDYINNQNGTIGGSASVSLTAQSVSANYLFAGIDNTGTGSIGTNATVDVNVSGNVTVVKDTTFRINGNNPGGIAAINVTGGNYDVGGSFLTSINGNGTITLTNATVHADILKIGVFGPNGTLKIGGGMLSADSTLKLYAPGSSGTIEFTANVTLNGGTSLAAIIAANTVTIDNGKTVTLSSSIPAQIYANVQNYNISGFGQFSGPFTSAPLSSAPGFGAQPIAPAVAPAALGAPPLVTTTAASPARTVSMSNSSELRAVLDQAPTTNGRVTVQRSAFVNTSAPAATPTAAQSTTSKPARIRSVAGVSTVESPTQPGATSTTPATSRTTTSTTTAPANAAVPGFRSSL